MISTPQTGADSLLLVASFLGWPLAWFMLVTTFVTGILGGTLVQLLAANDHGSEDQAKPTEPACALTNEAAVPAWQQYYRYAVDELIGGIYRYLIVGVLVAAAINLVVPPNALAGIPALQGMLGLVGVLAIAIPMYVCTNGSVPIAASLVASGLPAGSALVFLMAGSATNVATIGAVRRMLGQRIMLIYLGTIMLSSLGLALLFQSLWGNFTLAHVAVHQQHEMSLFMQITGTVSALALTALILRWAYLDLRIWMRKRFRPRNAADLEELVLQVDGMTCMNCAARIQRDLELAPGVSRVEINLETGLARMWGQALDRELLSQAVCKAGYTVKGFKCS
jgi:copper chaperone CopZ